MIISKQNWNNWNKTLTIFFTQENPSIQIKSMANGKLCYLSTLMAILGLFIFSFIEIAVK